MLTSNVVRTFAWIVILGRQGPISEALMALGLAASPISLMFTELGLVLAMTQIDLPLIVLPLMAILSRLPRQLSEAAEVVRRRTLADSGDRPAAADAAGPARRLDPCLRQHERLLRHPGRHRRRTKRLRAATHLPRGRNAVRLASGLRDRGGAAAVDRGLLLALTICRAHRRLSAMLELATIRCPDLPLQGVRLRVRRPCVLSFSSARSSSPSRLSFTAGQTLQFPPEGVFAALV